MAVSEAHRAANDRWDATNIRRTSLAIPKDLYERLKEHADATGQTVNGFIRRAIEAALDDTEGSGT